MDPVNLQFGEDGLRQRRLRKADHFRPADIEQPFQIGRGVVLKDRMGGEFVENFVPAAR